METAPFGLSTAIVSPHQDTWYQIVLTAAKFVEVGTALFMYIFRYRCHTLGSPCNMLATGRIEEMFCISLSQGGITDYA